MTLSLRDAFGAEEGELAVLSVAAVREETEPVGWRVTHASLLIVPEPFALASWSRWEETESGGGSPAASDPGTEFVQTDGTWLLARKVLGLAEADDWFQTLQHRLAASNGALVTLPSLAPLPELRAGLSTPDAIVRVFHGTDLPLSGLASGVRRPIRGLFWPDGDAPSFPLPEHVSLGGETFYSPGFELVGMTLGAWIDGELKTPRGVLVGRTERRAWLAQGKGADELRKHQFSIGWDPERIDLAELELSYIARLGGAVVLSTRIRLQDLEIDSLRDHGRATVSFDAMGAGVSHEAVLHSSSGELLDEMGPHFLAETVSMSIQVVGPNEPMPAPGSPASRGALTTVIGGNLRFPDLEDSLARQLEIEAQTARDLQSAARRRVLDTREGALARLRAALAHARDELLVYDPWFGVHGHEWSLLAGLQVPVRVVTGRLEREAKKRLDGSRPILPVGLPIGVNARYRRNSNMHDRVWIWRDGGIIVGGSPSTFGHSPINIRNLTPHESAEWRGRFEQKWNDPLFKPVPLAGARRRQRHRLR